MCNLPACPRLLPAFLVYPGREKIYDGESLTCLQILVMEGTLKLAASLVTVHLELETFCCSKRLRCSPPQRRFFSSCDLLALQEAILVQHNITKHTVKCLPLENDKIRIKRHVPLFSTDNLYDRYANSPQQNG